MTTYANTDGEWPAGWSDWPREQRLRYISMTHTRSGLLQDITLRAGIDREITDTSRLTVEELAAVALELGEVGP